MDTTCYSDLPPRFFETLAAQKLLDARLPSALQVSLRVALLYVLAQQGAAHSVFRRGYSSGSFD